MQAVKGSLMEKWLCWSSIGVAGVLLVLFLLDIAVGFPFGGGASLFIPIDIIGILACALVLYLSWDALRDLQ
jgi:hypothetical protein